MLFQRRLILAISFLLIGIVICQDVKQSIKNPVKGVIKSKRPGRVFDSKFYGSKFGSLYKPEDFFGDDSNSTKNSVPTSTIKISTLSEGRENLSGLKGRKLPHRNDLQAPIKSAPSPAKLTADGITEPGTTTPNTEPPTTESLITTVAD